MYLYLFYNKPYSTQQRDNTVEQDRRRLTALTAALRRAVSLVRTDPLYFLFALCCMVYYGTNKDT